MAPPAWQAERLTALGLNIFEAIAAAVLDGVLPDAPAAKAAALKAHLQRVELTILGLPKPVQNELALLLRLLGAAPGRLTLAGLKPQWRDATNLEVQAALQMLRASSLELRKQTYQALRDITYAAYFSDRSTWAALGYAGPMALPTP